jgi:hypothetical protein
LIGATTLSLVAALAFTIPSIHEVSAKECISNDGDNNNDENNNSNDDSTTCANQHGSKGHSATTAKDLTPFRLPIPFP